MHDTAVAFQAVFCSSIQVRIEIPTGYQRARFSSLAPEIREPDCGGALQVGAHSFSFCGLQRLSIAPVLRGRRTVYWWRILPNLETLQSDRKFPGGFCKLQRAAVAAGR